MNRGEREAHRFCRKVLPEHILASIGELGNEAYRRVLRACRADLDLEPDAGDEPRRRVLEAVPAECRRDVERLLDELIDAEFDKRRVAERACVLIGMAATRTGATSPLDDSVHVSPRTQVHAAARATVETVLRRGLIELREDTGRAYDAAYVAARGRLVEAIRHERQAPMRVLESLQAAVEAAAPESHQADVALTLQALLDEEAAETAIERDVAFALGLAFGQAVPDVPGWDLNSVLDAVSSSGQDQRPR